LFIRDSIMILIIRIENCIFGTLAPYLAGIFFLIHNIS
jgi:hypothetical protein